jgi:multiple antibiotic resistance protein
MTTLLSLKSQFHTINIIIAIILNIIVFYVIYLQNWKDAGKRLSKTFGVVLLAIAVKLFAANVKGLFINNIFL